MPHGRSKSRGNDLRDPVRVEFPARGHERPPLCIELPDDARSLGHLVERVADEQLDEGAFLLNDHDLLEATRELADDAGFEWEQHPELEQPDAVSPQIVV